MPGLGSDRSVTKKGTKTMLSAVATGNVGQNAKLKEVDGTPVMSFSLASRRYTKGEEKTDWVDISFWGKRATSLAQHVTKGSRVAVRGTIESREFTHNNEKRFGLSMRADDIELLGGGKGKDESSSSVTAPTEDIPF